MSILSRAVARLKAAVRPAAPRVAAALAPMSPPAGWWRHDAAEQLRHYQSWVYAAVNAIAQEAAKQRPVAESRDGSARHDRTPLPPDHPLAALLESPNPWLTAWELWYLTVVNLELTGNCFWYVASDSDTSLPAEVWIVPTPWVRVIPDAARFVAGYEVAAPAGPPERFGVDEIVHLKYPNPLDPHYGLSPLQANALTVDANAELLKSRCQTFQAGQRPGMVLHTDQTLTDPTIRRLEASLHAKYVGRENWHRPLILEQGLTATPWTLSPAEMDYLNSTRLSREEIFALFRVPGPVAGLTDHVGLGSEVWTGARAMFCEGTVQPKLDLLGQVLTRDLARRFGPDLAIRFPDCSPRDPAQRRADDELDAKLGLRTVNEIRRGRGLEPYPDARFDEPWIGASDGR